MINNDTHCADCSAAFVPSGCTPGYAILYGEMSKKVCYACADKRQVEDLKDRSRKFVGYLSGDKVTTWTGGKLMTVTSRRSCQLTRQSFTHDARGYVSVHAVDCHGGHWAGRGSDGIAIRLRPVKG